MTQPPDPPHFWRDAVADWRRWSRTERITAVVLGMLASLAPIAILAAAPIPH